MGVLEGRGLRGLDDYEISACNTIGVWIGVLHGLEVLENTK